MFGNKFGNKSNALTQQITCLGVELISVKLLCETCWQLVVYAKDLFFDATEWNTIDTQGRS